MTFAASFRAVYQSLFRLGVVSSAICWFFSASRQVRGACDGVDGIDGAGVSLSTNEGYTWSFLGPLPYVSELRLLRR
jgi:hypothetical protein